MLGEGAIDMKAVERLLNQTNDYATAAFKAAKRREHADADRLFAEGQRCFVEVCRLLGLNNVE